MTASITFASLSSLHTGTYVIFTVAAFFALCAVISYFIASAFENGRRDAALHAQLQDEFAARTDEPGDAIIRHEEDDSARHLQWPDDTSHDHEA
ncbi:MAG TPA: hypothetical protein VJQ83_12515 [Tepidiformaceae bacterium]|nr:hypothetical protein [Tepidiformaceae bacterium]